jgi:hypothetical protein
VPLRKDEGGRMKNATLLRSSFTNALAGMSAFATVYYIIPKGTQHWKS